MRPFPSLSVTTLEAINTVGRWLAQNDIGEEIAVPSDCVILAGNAVIPTIDAACRLANEQRGSFPNRGGIGPATTFLYVGLAQDPRFKTILSDGSQ